MTTPSELVTEQFEQSQTYAAEAMDLAESFLNTFADNLYTAPLVDIQWDVIDAPSVEAVPSAPVIDAVTLSLPAAPDALSLDPPDVVIDDFTDLAPAISIPAPPTIDIGTVPDVYSVVTPSIPDAPVLTDVPDPVYLDLTTPTFAGIDTHSTFLDAIETDLPTLTLAAPTAFSFTPSAAYTSTLKTALSTLLNDRVANGGTGLPPAVEALIWGRASDREDATAQDSLAETMKGFQNLGWRLPTGVIAAAVRKARQNLANRMADFSREVAMKQADLEQANIKHAIEQGVAWEGKLIDYSVSFEQLGFETAKAVAENAIQIHNAGLEEFKALTSLIQVRISLYDAIIKGELAKVDVYRAEIAAEQAKADTNRTLVEQFKAQIEARMSTVKIYEIRIEAAKTLVELERAKVDASAEAIRGFTAGVNAQTAKVELFKAQVQGEEAIAQVYETKVRGFAAKVGAQAEKARAELARFSALWQAKEAEYRGYTAQVDAERTRIMAESDIARVLVSAYEAETRTIEAKNNLNARLFEARVQQYKGQAEYTLNGQKINSDIIAHNRQVQLDASKTAAQIIAQIAGSALGAAHATAGVSGDARMSVSYSYSNQTSDSPASVTAV